jgi:hypothetical protein
VIPAHGTSAALATEERTMSMLAVSARSFAVGLLPPYGPNRAGWPPMITAPLFADHLTQLGRLCP